MTTPFTKVKGVEVFSYGGKSTPIYKRGTYAPSDAFIKELNALRKNGERPFETVKLGYNLYALNAPAVGSKGERTALVPLETDRKGAITKTGAKALTKLGTAWSERGGRVDVTASLWYRVPKPEKGEDDYDRKMARYVEATVMDGEHVRRIRKVTGRYPVAAVGGIAEGAHYAGEKADIITKLSTDPKVAIVIQSAGISEGVAIVEINSVTPAVPSAPMNPLAVVNHKDIVKLLADRHTRKELNPKRTEVADMFVTDTKEIPMACGINVCLQSIGAAIERYKARGDKNWVSGNKRCDVSWFWSLATDEKSAPMTDDGEYDGARMGMTIPQLAKVFQYYRIGLTVINDEDEVVYEYNPDSPRKDLGIQRVAVKHKNEHFYMLTAEAVKSIAHKELKEYNVCLMEELEELEEFEEPAAPAPIGVNTDVDEIVKMVECGTPHIMTSLDLSELYDVLVSYAPEIEVNHAGEVTSLVLDVKGSIVDIEKAVAEEKPAEAKPLETFYRLRKFKEAGREVFINDINELARIDVEASKTGETIRVYTNLELCSVLHELLTKASYEPRVSMNSFSEITGLMMNMAGRYVYVSNPDNPDIVAVGRNEVQADEFALYKKMDQKLYQSLLSGSTMSHYNNSTVDFFREFTPKPLTCTFRDAVGEILREVDCVKAYTSLVMEMPRIPVICHFDYPRMVDNDCEIESDTWYMVEPDCRGALRNLVFTQDRSCWPGYALSKLPRESFTIVAALRPSRVVRNTVPGVVSELYASDLGEAHKKFLCNKLVGYCGKVDNARVEAKLFSNQDEAADYAYRHRGVKSIAVPLSESLTYYAAVKETRAELMSGFLPIQSWIYCMMRVKLWEMAREYGDPVYCRTDALVFDRDIPLLSVNGNAFENIGHVRVRDATDKRAPLRHIDEIHKYETEVRDYKSARAVRAITVEDEYDTTALNAVFDAERRLIVRGCYPGAGKTQALINWSEGKKVAFCAPYNTQTKWLAARGLTASTVFKFFGMSLDDTGKCVIRRMNTSEYDAVVFDEFDSYENAMKHKVRRFAAENPDIKVFATGDVSQLENVGDAMYLNNLKRCDWDAYMTDAAARVFPAMLTLSVCKRVGEGHRAIIEGIKRDCDNPALSNADIIRKYATPTKVVRGRAICYTNENVKRFGAMVQEKFVAGKTTTRIGDLKVVLGQELTCRQYYKAKKSVLHVNYVYEVEAVKGGVVTLRDGAETFEVPAKVVSERFVYPWAVTGHSSQGQTYDEDVTIIDGNNEHANKKWLYVVLTRCRDPTRLYYFTGACEATTVDAAAKLAGYKEQDRRAGRTWKEEDYVTEAQIRAMAGGVCVHCCTPVSASGDTQFTLDRLDNERPHLSDNVCVACLSCNRARTKFVTH